MVPNSFAYFDRCAERAIADLSACRDTGRRIAGIYCIYAPVELIRAAGAVPVGLCGKNETPIEHAEKDLPANLCPLIKSSYGYAVSDTCPFFSLTDWVVGETTCDGKKKMYEFLDRVKPVYLMHLPYSQDLAGARDLWISEIERFARFLTEKTGIAPGTERLRDQIRLHNTMRHRLRQVIALAADPRGPLSGLQVLTLLESKSFVVDLDTYVARLEMLAREMQEMIANTPDRPAQPPCRILLTGCPVGKGSEKVVRLIEEAGGSVVCMENCTGLKSILDPIDEDKDPVLALADRYLQIPCACMTPNPRRFDAIRRLAADFQIDGVVDLTWHFCHTYHIEAGALEEAVGQSPGIPFLHLVTDYAASDTEQLRTRIEAFLEIATS